MKELSRDEKAYVKNMQLRVNKMRRDALPQHQEPPLCKCGCGEPVTWKRNRHRWKSYVNWEHCLRHTSELHPIPKCQCGCGLDTIRADNGNWLKYLPGHRSRRKQL